jgi:hypothetical protein
MKRKFLLPLLTVMLAVITSVASPFFAQSGWYDSNGSGTAGVGTSGSINEPAGDNPVCGVSGSAVCKINFLNAYNSQANAEAGGDTGLLRYTPQP